MVILFKYILVTTSNMANNKWKSTEKGKQIKKWKHGEAEEINVAVEKNDDNLQEECKDFESKTEEVIE